MPIAVQDNITRDAFGGARLTAFGVAPIAVSNAMSAKSGILT